MVHTGALSAYAAELASLECRESLQDRGHKRNEMNHPIRGSEDKQDSERQPRDVLLELDASVHGEQSIVVAMHATKKIPVLDAGPAAPDDSGGAVAFEHSGEI